MSYISTQYSRHVSNVPDVETFEVWNVDSPDEHYSELGVQGCPLEVPDFTPECEGPQPHKHFKKSREVLVGYDPSRIIYWIRVKQLEFFDGSRGFWIALEHIAESLDSTKNMGDENWLRFLINSNAEGYFIEEDFAGLTKALARETRTDA